MSASDFLQSKAHHSAMARGSDSARDRARLVTPVATERPAGRLPGSSTLPRVLYVIAMDPAQKFGSAEEQIVVFAHAFQADNSLLLPLFNCASSPEHPTAIEQAGVPIATLDMRHFRWQTLRQLLALIRRHEIDLVHWNFSHPIRNSYLWWLTLLQPRIKHYHSERISQCYPLASPVGGWKRICKRLLLQRYSRVLCVSRFVADNLAAQNCWPRLACCPHFVNCDRFKPCPSTREAVRSRHNATSRFVILTVANLIHAKGIDVALRALSELPQTAVLWIVGTGAEEGALRQFANTLGLGGRVVFHGNQRQVEPFMQAADCLVCPSLWAEAAGLVNLEAQATGLPVIASDVGGIPEYVAHGETGYLFPPGDVATLTALVHGLMTDGALRDNLGKSGRSLVEQKFSARARVDAVLDLYRTSVVETKRS